MEKLLNAFWYLKYTNIILLLVSWNTRYSTWNHIKFVLKNQLLTLLEEQYLSNLNIIYLCLNEGLFASLEELLNSKIFNIICVKQFSWTDFKLYAEACSVLSSCKQLSKREIKYKMALIIGQKLVIVPYIVLHFGLWYITQEARE